MKDAAHHLKWVQKKVIQSIRKPANGSRSFTRQQNNNGIVSAEKMQNGVKVL